MEAGKAQQLTGLLLQGNGYTLTGALTVVAEAVNTASLLYYLALKIIFTK